MFNCFKIIYIAVFTLTQVLPVFAGQVGAIESNKPSWYAVIDTGAKGKKLYMKGDIFSSDKNPIESFRILDIQKDALVLEDVYSKDGVILKPGDRIPVSGAGLVFESTVEAKVLEYNYDKSAKRFTKNQIEDFTIKSLERKKITLERPYDASLESNKLSDQEKDLFKSPRSKNSKKESIIIGLFDKIEAKKIGDNMWALDRSSIEPAMRNAGAALVSAIKRVEPGYRFGEGPSLKFNTDLGTAVVNKEGFLIQDVTFARFADKLGLQEGDIIKSVNGCSVNSLLGIYRAYENLASNKGAGALNFSIVRDGKTKTLVYRVSEGTSYGMK